MAKLTKIKNDDGQVIFPVTHAAGVAYTDKATTPVSKSIQDTIGDMASLTTDNYTSTATDADKSIVGALNEVDAQVTLLRSLIGMHDKVVEVTLTSGTAGSYVKTDGTTATDAAYCISTEVEMKAGNFYLVNIGDGVTLKSDAALFAREEKHTEHIITGYGTDADGNPDYDSPVYEDSETTVFTPHFQNETVYGKPDEGLYVFPCVEDETIVISLPTAAIDNKMQVMKADFLSVLADQLLTDDKARVLTEAVNVAYGLADSAHRRITDGHSVVNADSHYTCMGQPTVLYAAGVPAAATVPENWNAGVSPWEGIPTFIGQQYLDTTNKKVYTAFGTSTVGDWA